MRQQNPRRGVGTLCHGTRTVSLHAIVVRRNNWNRFSTTSYKKSPCVQGCVLAVPVVPRVKTHLSPADRFVQPCAPLVLFSRLVACSSASYTLTIASVSCLQ